MYIMTSVHVSSNGHWECREDGMESMSLVEFMNNQRCILHGGDYRCFKYQPKVCVCVCLYSVCVCVCVRACVYSYVCT